MTSYRVKVKWGKEVFPDVELNKDELPIVFRAQIFALTGVQPHRQKIMVKGTTIKDDDWGDVKLRDGALVLMMGSKDEDIPDEPVERPKFLEDMTEEEANCALDLPVGIYNLGNTCYLNAVVQCLKVVPEVHSAITTFEAPAGIGNSSGSLLTAGLRNLFKSMDMGRTIYPVPFVDMFRTTFPRFAEQDAGGKYIQQDASECWTEVVRLLQDALPANKSEKSVKAFGKSLIEQYFCGQHHITWKCEEDGDEEIKELHETFQHLSCHINQDVKYLHTGLSAKIKEKITKNSPTLNRDAVYTKKTMISRLPAYLSVEMIRFFFKEKESINAKILKDVKFPMVLDVLDLCEPQLQEKLLPIRDSYKKMDDMLLEERKLRKLGKVPDFKYTVQPTQFEDDLGSNNSAFYQLNAVLTHQGRTSSSGHYLAWIRFKDDAWLKCDDDDITPVTEDEILKLSGGGDWHTAYILLYGPRELRVYEDTDAIKATVVEEEKMETDEIKK